MKLLKSRNVYKGTFINVKIVEYEDEGEKYSREIIESREGVLIIALTDTNSIVLIKQHRSNHGVIYEVPAGAINEGELPLIAAKRELKEEAGIEAKKWKLVSTHHNGIHEEGYNYIYLAQGLSFVPTKFDDDEKILPPEFFSLDKAIKLINDNKIIDIRNRACIWLAKCLMISNII